MSKFKNHDINLQIINSVINLQNLDKLSKIKQSKSGDNSHESLLKNEIKAVAKV